MIMDRKKGLSSGDKKMLMTAKNFLISELMVVEHTEKEAAGNAIEDAVKA